MAVACCYQARQTTAEWHYNSLTATVAKQLYGSRMLLPWRANTAEWHFHALGATVAEKLHGSPKLLPWRAKHCCVSDIVMHWQLPTEQLRGRPMLLPRRVNNNWVTLHWQQQQQRSCIAATRFYHGGYQQLRDIIMHWLQQQQSSCMPAPRFYLWGLATAVCYCQTLAATVAEQLYSSPLLLPWRTNINWVTLSCTDSYGIRAAACFYHGGLTTAECNCHALAVSAWQPHSFTIEG